MILNLAKKKISENKLQEVRGESKLQKFLYKISVWKHIKTFFVQK